MSPLAFPFFFHMTTVPLHREQNWTYATLLFALIETLVNLKTGRQFRNIQLSCHSRIYNTYLSSLLLKSLWPKYSLSDNWGCCFLLLLCECESYSFLLSSIWRDPETYSLKNWFLKWHTGIKTKQVSYPGILMPLFWVCGNTRSSTVGFNVHFFFTFGAVNHY